MEFTLGELFSGPGGLAKGATSVQLIQNGEVFGVNHGWANDIDSDSCNTYINNILNANDENVFCEDVKNLNFENLNTICSDNLTKKFLLYSNFLELNLCSCFCS